MGCVLVLALLGVPRIALIWVWLWTPGYLTAAYDSVVWPLVGFFMLPYTTLAFAFASNSLGAAGEVPPLGWLLTLIGLVFDLGFHGGAGARRRKRRKRRNDDD